MKTYGAKQASLNILRIYLQHLSNSDLSIMKLKAINSKDLLDIVYNGEIKTNMLTKLGTAIKLLRKPSTLLKIKTTSIYNS